MTVAPNPDTIIQRITQIQAQLSPPTRLIAVTKTHPAAMVRIAYGAGLRHFGESRLQEAIDKQAALMDLPDITWHLIGHLQTNKVRKAVHHFQWIHSLDSVKLARKLDQVAAETGKNPQCCLQVKMVADPPKTGFSLAELETALPALDQLQHLRIQGLMTIPPLSTSETETHRIFQGARTLANQINQSGFERIFIQDLSMGMSADYPHAIAAGATWIRLGSILFGQRPD